MSDYASETGMIFNIQRFSVYDGPGIRTNVFMKGCPLRCEWCHNPEGLSAGYELSFLKDHCVYCGACTDVCVPKAHEIEPGFLHRISRSKCLLCGRCAQHCPTGALEWMGTQKTALEIIEHVARDRAFFGSDGGMTLTGGEPMAQPAFAFALAALAKERGIGVCLETCGFCSQEWLLRIAPLIDQFLFDCKETRAEQHLAYTGAALQPIMDNLHALDRAGAAIVLRCPLIPGKNTEEEHYAGIAALANDLTHLIRIELEPYHAMGIEKNARLGRPSSFALEQSMPRADAEKAAQYIRTSVGVPVSVS